MNFGDDDDEDRTFSEISCGANCTAPKVLVGIVRVDTENGKTLYVLKLSIVGTLIEWMVKRRYSEFLELREEVYNAFLHRNVNQCFGCRWFLNSLRDFGFPRKHLMSSKEMEIIRFRKNRLDRFARLLAAHTFSAIPKCVRCREQPFNRIRDFFTTDALLPIQVTATQLRQALVPERFAAIADPLKSKIEFRRGHGIFKVIQVEKPILVKRKEIEEATRARRMQRRRSSTSSAAQRLTGPPDRVDLEEEKHAVPPPLKEEIAAESELPSVSGEVVATANAVALQPLALAKHDQTTPRADAAASRWDRWELASPKRTVAAKEA